MRTDCRLQIQTEHQILKPAKIELFFQYFLTKVIIDIVLPCCVFCFTL